MNTFSKDKKGFTLVEVITAMVILSLLTLAAVYLLQMGVASNVTAARDYDIQSGGRIIMEIVTNKIRYSTAVFVIPESGFSEDNLERGWDYVGVLKTENGLSEIVHFRYEENPDTGSWYHKKTVLLEAREGFYYELEFKKQDESYENQLINYICTVYQGSSEYWTISSEVAAMNSLQVVNWGTDTNKGRALAFQSTDREPGKVTGRVAMVLDVSGSMAFSFAGVNNNSKERYNAMVKSALQLLDKFADYDNIEVTIIPYADTANMSDQLKKLYGSSDYIFMNAQLYKTQLYKIVNSLSSSGGTNTGDGLRRAYYALLQDGKANSRRTVDYVILLSDGDMTFATMEDLRAFDSRNKITLGEVINRGFFMSSGDTTNTSYGLLFNNGYLNEITGEADQGKVQKWLASSTGGSLTGYNTLKGSIDGAGTTVGRAIDVYSKGYVNTMGGILINYGVTPYFVAVSSSVSDTGIEIVKSAMNIDASSVYNPLSQQALLDAFESIGEAIVSDLWFINGPSW